MKSTIIRVVGAVALAAVVACGTAHAWGPRAQQSISLMAMQVVKEKYPAAFKAGATNYERDCLLGAAAGVSVLQGKVPLGTDAEALQAVGTEIELLRAVRDAGMASYFAYRMGVLSALVSNVMTPYGFATAPGDELVQQRMFSDIEKNLDTYKYSPNQSYREVLSDPLNYFRKKRAFFGDDRKIIAEDYALNRGYNGFLKQGGPVYFDRCVEAVADAWATVLARELQTEIPAASRRAQTWYYVDEIDYLLLTKKNPQGAERAYENFHKVVQNEPETYERIGDSFAAYGGKDGIDRAVREWQNAFNMAGENRQSVATKLNKHFLEVGKNFLESASKPGADDNDYPTALRAFESALEFDRRSDEAADNIQKTHVLINERNARHDTTLKLIASAEKLTTQADGLTKNDDFGGAIKTYRQAMSFYASIDDEFKDEARKGKEGVRNVKTAINGTVDKVLKRGSEAIEQGDKAVDEKRFEEAINLYNTVEGVVSVIPDENITGSKTHAQQKRDMIELAKGKVEDAKKAKLKEEERKKAEEAARKSGKKPAAAGAAGGAAGAGAAAPAPAPAK